MELHKIFLAIKKPSRKRGLWFSRLRTPQHRSRLYFCRRRRRIWLAFMPDYSRLVCSGCNSFDADFHEGQQPVHHSFGIGAVGHMPLCNDLRSAVREDLQNVSRSPQGSVPLHSSYPRMPPHFRIHALRLQRHSHSPNKEAIHSANLSKTKNFPPEQRLRMTTPLLRKRTAFHRKLCMA